jgi:agmatinase
MRSEDCDPAAHAMNEVIPFAGLFSTTGDPSPWGFLGICDDSQSSFLRGPAEAPESIRRAYDGRCYNATSESGVDLASSVTDLGDLKPLATWTASAELYRARIAGILRDGVTPFVAGGDHAVTVPVLAAYSVLERPVHVIQIDAHPDLYPDFEGNRDSHACTGARLLEMRHVESLTQLGIRTLSREQRRNAERFSDRLRIVEAQSLERESPDLSHIPADAPVFLTVDMDGFDPAFAPGVSHPVPGGLTARQALTLIQSGHWTLVGMDVVEVNPLRDLQSMTAILAARLLHEGIAYAASRAAR